MKRALSCIATVAIAACATDPLPQPEIPVAARYTPTPVALQDAAAGVHGGGAQQLVAGSDIPGEWWTLFKSPALDGLVRRALDASPTLTRAQARLRQAHEDLNARSGATGYPRVDAKLSANRVDANPQSLGVPTLPVPLPLNLYLASISVSYTFDFAGAVRHELEALRAEVDHQAYELEAARLMLAGNVVTTAIREASLRERIATTEEILALQSRQLTISGRLVELGGLARADLATQERELAQARAALPELRGELERLRHRLAVLVGDAPGTGGLPEVRLAELELPGELPLSLPSRLARQRPDIRAAEALLAQAGARVGVATANLYPQFTLSANAGSLAAAAGDLFGSGSGFYVLGASLVQPIFRGGELPARRRSAVAAYEQAAAGYREAVLQGLQNVADALRALEADGGRLKERADAATQARRVRDIAAERYKAGGVSEAAMLDAARQHQRALLDQTQAVADRYADSAALLQALGGGWWREP